MRIETTFRALGRRGRHMHGDRFLLVRILIGPRGALMALGTEDVSV